MANTNDLLNRINSRYSSMSKGQKLLATYISDNYDKAVFLTAAKMGAYLLCSILPLLSSVLKVLEVSKCTGGGKCKDICNVTTVL